MSDVDATETPGGRTAGLFGSVRQMLATAVALAHTRVELFTTEIEAEIQRAVALLIWAFVALFFAGLTVLMLALTIVIAVWDEHRLLAAGLMTLVFVVVVVVAGLVVRAKVARRPHLLGSTIEELKRDRAALEARL
jgi:uncharacterized membrane protein YqjE